MKISVIKWSIFVVFFLNIFCLKELFFTEKWISINMDINRHFSLLSIGNFEEKKDCSSFKLCNFKTTQRVIVSDVQLVIWTKKNAITFCFYIFPRVSDGRNLLREKKKQRIERVYRWKWHDIFAYYTIFESSHLPVPNTNFAHCPFFCYIISISQKLMAVK